MPITRDTLLTLEAYSQIRKPSLAAASAHRQLRRVQLDAHMALQFEDEQTIRRQIQEVLQIEKVFDAAGIQAQIDAYAPLLPDGSNWKATLLIGYPDPAERRRALAQLVGVQHHLFVAVAGQSPVYAVVDDGLDCGQAGKTSAVHFVRFDFSPAVVRAVHAGAAVRLGCDHRHAIADVAIAPQTLASLAGDLQA